MMRTPTPKEVYEKAKQDHHRAWKEYDDVYKQASAEKTKANAKLRETYDKGLAGTRESFNQALKPKQRELFDVAAVRMNDAREAFNNSPEHIEYKAHQKRTESRMTKLYFIASFIFYCAWSAFGNVFSLVSYNDLITKPIPVLIFFGGYLVGIRWLNKNSHIRILRGTLFNIRQIATSEDKQK